MAVGPFSIFKQRLRRCIVDSIYNEIVTNTSRYYHWLGKENKWSDFLSPYIPSSDTDVPGPPQNNFRYDLHVRRDMLTLKRVEPHDVSYVVPRIDWESGVIYDMYDDGITTPITSAKPWVANSTVYELSENPDPTKFYVDDLIKYNGLYYKIRTAGTLNSNPPVHTTGEATYGTVSLYYYTRDVIAPSGATSLEQSRFYVLSSQDNQYNVYKCIWNNNNKPSTVEPNGTSTDVFTTSDGYKWKYLYTIPLTARSKFLTDAYMPVVNALKLQFYANGEIGQVVIENEGTGYTAPRLTVNGDGTGAALTAVVESGQITSVIVDDPGQNYSYATILVNAVGIANATSSGTTATINTIDNHTLITGNTVIIRGMSVPGYNGGPYTVTKVDDNTFTITTTGSNLAAATGGIAEFNALPGSGAVLQADFSIGSIDTNQANVELTAIPASIESYKVVDGGSGYVTAPSVTIQGDGTGATASAKIAGGQVVQIDPVTVGSGYTWTNIVIEGGGGTGSTARAIMSPTYGHGSNAIDELNANSLMMFTSFSNDKNQGMVITNDYRKVGLVRNITKFDPVAPDNRERFKLKLGSGCVKVKPQDPVTGVALNPLTLASQGKLAQDWLLLNTQYQYKKYRVIDFDDEFILLSVFNNFEIEVGDVLGVDQPPETGLSQEANLFTFAITEVTQRTVNQFSGDLLFLRVSEPFSEQDQAVTVRTVITI